MSRYSNKGVDKRCARNVATRNKAKQAPIQYTNEQLKGMFMLYDKNGDGRLSRKELKEAFNYFGALIPGWRANSALNFADDNGDGYISENEIEELVKYAAQFGYKMK